MVQNLENQSQFVEKRVRKRPKTAVKLLAKVNRDNGIFFYLTEYSSRYNGVSDVSSSEPGWRLSGSDLVTGRISGSDRTTGSDFGSDLGSDVGSDPAIRARKTTGAWW